MQILPQSRVLITGAASGLGLALVHRLIERDCRVLATDVHTEAPESLRGLTGVTYRRLDVTQDVDWSTAYEWVVEEWDGLDLLFNNAGVAAGGRIELSEMDQWQWIVDINLLGVARGCRTFTPMLKQQGSGHIVNTASAAGLIHPPRMSEYNAVKAGVVALSETLLHELKPYGVNVSVVCPTFFRTNLTESLRGKDEASQKMAAKLIDRSRVSADDIAGEVLGGVEKDRHLILTDRDGRIAYAAKRFARPLYYRMMAKASTKMSKGD
ncbi:SDR family NAD(P)-dependent oxidoreductase [Aeromicrobium sp. SMF47]|uniref:SDR family NAD(P)-dependent oxidoreductase n=1 Tax=Aeromicrobium yanjiei TaxID=2662028 RepID=A0A5Q2MQD4_9ACTN|nr:MULTISPECIES: SDR family NAD(P)-dependent oxidoreductase [Aeromicrobium]MRJ75754.1 SDR family NAD(P)-dependent oxidoreductase [Aeromicrobium yanjiei]MRK00098.1 SDR family NAD(P)-dependent oxidoreductase [Aeromicrobium sp. S22]QGG42995.1 SDR family NAD(P)-dependent oxidoreductase [Aeromicrobium yanjiei]